MKLSKVIIVIVAFLFVPLCIQAQANGTAVIYTGATIHVGNGTVITNGTLICQGGKITYVGQNIPAATGKNGLVKDVKGKHIYPGLIALNNIAGLSEIDQAKPTHDFAETGFMNPHIRSAPAYNCDSKILPTLTYNGILFTQPTPQGSGITGSSSIMSTSCSNWPQAAVKTDAVLHIHWPEFAPYPGMAAERVREARDKNTERIMQLKTFFIQAAAYCRTPQNNRELKFEACRQLFSAQQKVFIHATQPDVFIDAALFFKSLQVNVVWATANRAAEIIPFLQEHRQPVVVNAVHRLPPVSQSHVNEPYELPALLARNNIQFAITYSGSWEVRSLPYSIGTAITYELDKETALSAVTAHAAQVAGVSTQIGTLEEGKLASLLICTGDIFDMSAGRIEEVLLNGVEVDLNNNRQLQLYQKYNSR